VIRRPAPSAHPAGGPAATARATIQRVLRDEILPVLRDYFATRANGVMAAYLFGSVARGQERPWSDVDIGVVLGSRRMELSDLDRCAQMQIELCDRLGREVDLVPIDSAAPDLRYRVLRDGILLREADSEARIEFEILTRNEYLDLMPHLQRYRDTVLGRR
jgi:uncharacterized protein